MRQRVQTGEVAFLEDGEIGLGSAHMNEAVVEGEGLSKQRSTVVPQHMSTLE